MTTSLTVKRVDRRPRASIIIPAYNEERVIRRCLRALLDNAVPGEFDIIVVCNGCSDDTEAMARREERGVRVFAIEEASKTGALNFGDRVAKAFPRVYLDADLEVSGKAVRSLITTLNQTQRLAAIGFMDVDLRERMTVVRRFYELWMLHPYLRAGKFGGIYALSREGCLQRGIYPDIIADDTFVRECFAPEECVAVPACRFRVFPPHTLGGIVRIRSRCHLGNLQLRDRVNRNAQSLYRGCAEWACRVACRPQTWIWLPVYLAVNVAARVRAASLYRRRRYEWLRDESSRDAAQATYIT